MAPATPTNSNSESSRSRQCTPLTGGRDAAGAAGGVAQNVGGGGLSAATAGLAARRPSSTLIRVPRRTAPSLPAVPVRDSAEARLGIPEATDRHAARFETQDEAPVMTVDAHPSGAHVHR